MPNPAPWTALELVDELEAVDGEDVIEIVDAAGVVYRGFVVDPDPGVFRIHLAPPAPGEIPSEGRGDA